MSETMAQVDIRDAFFDEVYRIAAEDPKVVFLSADADAFSLRRFMADFPDRYINAGVAEQNMLTVAAGLALSGLRVFTYAIIPFITMRCYEHIKANICSMNLPVTIIGAGAGLSFSYDGPTHHAVQDIAVMRTLPELTILNPCDGPSAAVCARAAHRASGPTYVRLDKGVLPTAGTAETVDMGARVVLPPAEVTIVGTGMMTHRAVEAAALLESRSIKTGVVDLPRVKPINETVLLDLLSGSRLVVTLEENALPGGIGTALSELFTDRQITMPLRRIGLPDKQYFDYGTRDWLHELYHIDASSVASRIAQWYGAL